MKIKETFNKNGYEYRLFKGEKLNDKRYKAIYEQIDQSNGHKVVAYEVQIIRKITDRFGTRFKNPSNSEWGTMGWTYKKLDKAEVKYAPILP